jgi:hypothetical protein
MRSQFINTLNRPHSCKILIYFAAVLIQLIPACTTPTQRAAFNPKTCLEIIPHDVKGLTVIEGPRTEQSIIRDMVPAICSGKALFKHMESRDESIKPGRVVFKVSVEWTGEVNRVITKESSIQSKKFLRKVSDFIMDSDFVVWSRHDTDTVFLYPVDFNI